MDALIFALALHVLAVVIWIGGMSMVTVVLLPAVRRGALGSNRLQVFEVIKRRFVWIARAAVLVVGATGFYMVTHFDSWGRFRARQFWWMHAMVVVWMLFAIILFIVEPLGLQRQVLARGTATPELLFIRMHRVHMVLLTLALITITGAVAGSHGWVF